MNYETTALDTVQFGNVGFYEEKDSLVLSHTDLQVWQWVVHMRMATPENQSNLAQQWGAQSFTVSHEMRKM